jgi:anti-sigma factor RsiW
MTESAEKITAKPASSGLAGARTALALLCACMVLFAATLRLAHTHTAAEQESGRCQICSSIHTAAPTVATPVPVVLHAAPDPVATPAPKNPATTRIISLSDRAPPTLA